MCQRGHVLWAVDGDPPGPPLIRIARPAPANRVFDWGVMAGYELTFTLASSSCTRPLSGPSATIVHKLSRDWKEGSLQVHGHEADCSCTATRRIWLRLAPG